MRQQTYAVWWEEPGSARHAGKLQLGTLHLLLSGNGSGRIALPLDQIASVSYLRGELYIQRRGGAELRIGNLDGPGVLLELSDALAAQRSGLPDQSTPSPLSDVRVSPR